jgi:mediator of RNA polymerase II transcription subunit 16
LILASNPSANKCTEAQATFINEAYRALPINCNFTVEQDKLMNHPYIPRCLSIQAALGFKNKYTPRSFASSIPWAILQLRHASVLYAFFFQYNKGGATEPHDPGEIISVD